MTPVPTPANVARWMLDKIERDGYLYQESAVYDIAEMFGQQFVYENENGNLAIEKTVLAAFRRLSEETVVWERGQRVWRKRESCDLPGRQQY